LKILIPISLINLYKGEKAGNNKSDLKNETHKTIISHQWGFGIIHFEVSQSWIY